MGVEKDNAKGARMEHCTALHDWHGTVAHCHVEESKLSNFQCMHACVHDPSVRADDKVKNLESKE